MRPPPPLKENIREKIWEDGKIKMKPDDPQLFTDLFSVLVSYEKNVSYVNYPTVYLEVYSDA